MPFKDLYVLVHSLLQCGRTQTTDWHDRLKCRLIGSLSGDPRMAGTPADACNINWQQLPQQLPAQACHLNWRQLPEHLPGMTSVSTSGAFKVWQAFQTRLVFAIHATSYMISKAFCTCLCLAQAAQ